MKYHDGAALPIAQPVATRQEKRAGPVRTILMLGFVCGAASAAIGTGGLILAAAAGYELTEAQGFIIAATATPWLILALFLLLIVWRRGVWLIEELTARDLDNDAHIGTPWPYSEPDRVEIDISHKDRNGRETGGQFLEVPGVSAGLLRQFAEAAADNESLAVNAWVGTGKPFTRTQYDGLMAELWQAGLVTQGAGNRGRELTAAGRAVMRRIAGR